MNTHYTIYCKTNLDDHQKEEWPHFSASLMPRIGENVMSKSGKVLKVVGVTYYENDRTENMRVLSVEIELHH